RQVEIPLQMVGEAVQHRLDRLVISDSADRAAEPREEGAAERITSEQPVQIAAGDPAIGADCPVRTTVEVEHRAGDARAGGRAEMHLVAAYRRISRDIV